MHLLKTYHESTLKEYMYVRRDVDKAEQSGHALIELDPAWSPSYGEMAEAYVWFGQLGKAANMYDEAVLAGPPYYGHHLLRSARVHEKIGEHERALACYQTLAQLVPEDAAVLQAGRDIARSVSASSAGYFEDLLGPLQSPAASADQSLRFDTP
jgi:tetratricopeptide (TPR) repeat protein